MPLRDHFHSPVNDTHSWDEVHGGWPMEIVRDLSKILPAGYRAAPRVHLGSAFEVDVGNYELDHRDARFGNQDGEGTRTALKPTFSVEADMSDQDEYEVRIYDAERGRQLVAAIEIVSPANKDRQQTRELFAGKVVALLQQGVAVSIVDLVTARRGSMYANLLTLLGHVDPQLAPTPSQLYAVSLRTGKPPGGRSRLDAWYYPMLLGLPLPTIPIWLNEELRVMLPLESSYEETCRVLGIA
jgi:hypothetical protein